MAVLYDMAMVVGGETRLRPLLTRTLQRLLFHTSFPVGLIFLGPMRANGDGVEAQLDLAIGDHEIAARAGEKLTLPAALLAGEAAFAENPSLLAGLAFTARRYTTYLRLPIDHLGVILLLAPRPPHADLELHLVFQPVMANLSKAIVLCRDHEAHAAGLLAQRDAALLELAESAETLRATGEVAFDAIIVCDDAARITYCNPSAARVFGYSTVAEMTGRDLHELLVPARYRARAHEGFRRFRETGQGPALDTTRELEAVRKDGTEFPVELALSAMTVKGRRMAVGILRDISARKRIEEQLRRSQRLDALGQLAAGVAHDFNNLLVIINGYAEMAIATLPAGAPMRADLEQIRDAGMRAARLTRQLLAFGRKQVLAPVVVSLNAIVGDLQSMLRHTVGEDIDLELRLAPDLGNVRADPSQLEQILVNLVVNARDAMPQGGQIVLETANVEIGAEGTPGHIEAAPGTWVVLSASDTGCGIDEQTMARIFEPFFTTKPAGKGSGLGLATVYGIVKQSGGHLAVESQVGQGATFRIYLPRVSGEVGAGPEAAVAQAAGTETILVVEDDEGVRRAAQRALRSLGYEVLTAAGPTEALRLCREREGPVHLVLTDVVMPTMNGVELAERLGAIRRDLPVLYMSGYANSSVARHGELPTGASFIQKPFTAVELGRKIRETLDRAAERSGRA